MNPTRALALLLADAAQGWVEHRAQRLGASLAFYATLALAPLAIIAIAVAGTFFGEEAARGEIVHQLERFVGTDSAVAIEALIEKAKEPRQSRIATILSTALLVVGATGVFAELRDSLDTVWEVKRKAGLGLLAFVKTQAIAFTVVMGTGLLLLASLLLTAALTSLTQWLGRWLPGAVWTIHLLEVSVSFAIVTQLFALIFKLLPDVTLRWRDVWVGSVVTGVLFMIGKSLIGAYIGSVGIGSIYGAAASLVVLLVWTYYSSQILFFGAELIRSYTKRYGMMLPVPADQPEGR